MLTYEQIQVLEGLANRLRDGCAASIEAEIRELYELLEVEWALCKFCEAAIPVTTAHLHNYQLVGDLCCWTEQLRGSE